MTTRDTLLRVTLPLVWEDGILFCGYLAPVGDIHQWQNGTGWGWWVRDHHGARHYHGDLPTRAAAETAVEAAVMAALGERREG